MHYSIKLTKSWSVKWLSHICEWAMFLHQCMWVCKCAGVFASVKMCECKWNENMCMNENSSMSTSVSTIFSCSFVKQYVSVQVSTSLSCFLYVSTSPCALSIGDVWDNFTIFFIFIHIHTWYLQLLHPPLENFLLLACVCVSSKC